MDLHCKQSFFKPSDPSTQPQLVMSSFLNGRYKDSLSIHRLPFPYPAMANAASDTHTTTTPTANKPHLQPKSLNYHHRNHKLSLVYAFATCGNLFILFQICSLHGPTSAPKSLDHAAAMELRRLREAVTFLPLKDLRYSHAALRGHTWFMSSTNDTQEREGGAQFQHFPSASSQGRVLCLKGGDRHDGSWNSYALAWPDALPLGATLMKNLTFVSYNHYDYANIWHGLTAIMPFVSWYMDNHSMAPARWILYHWGEIRTQMAPWLEHLIMATFGANTVEVEGFEGVGERVTCFEEAVVTRHNEGGMSRQKRMDVYDLLRCRAREYCNVTKEVYVGSKHRGAEQGSTAEIGMTLLMRTGARSFKNESIVVGIFERECAKVEGCRMVIAHSNNQSFCEQVKLMSGTDILVSAHGAQLTNMFLMDRNSSVMEFFPKGWLRLAGVGQYVYRWEASWSGMHHEGAWRDPDGQCPFPDDDRRCMAVYKVATIGHNENYFAEWTRRVLGEVRSRKTAESAALQNSGSGCGFQ